MNSVSSSYCPSSSSSSSAPEEGLDLWWCTTSHPVVDNDGYDSAPYVSLGTIHPGAFVISTTTIALLLIGVKESKRITNWFTGLKLILVALIMVIGACYIQLSHYVPFLPFGWTGTFQGATGTFFG